MYEHVLKPGDMLGGKYRIARELGRGGMGVVFEAENVYTKRRVAIKCMHAHEAPSGEGQSRWLREAQAAARIQHRNVVDLYDVGFEQDSVFLVMELLSGETLASLLERTQLPIPEFLRLLSQAMRGVAHAHRVGIIHRDIKPENILLAREADQPELVPKILDFGIAKLDDIEAITGSGHALGTPLFMSLEQLRGQRDLDGRVDVYGFGVILYMALTGRPPYAGNTLPELIYNVTTLEALPPEVLRPELPSALCNVVASAIAKKREARTGSVQQLIEQLAPFCTENGLAANLGATTLLSRREHTTAPAIIESGEAAPVAPPSTRLSTTALTTPGPIAPKRAPKDNGVVWSLVAGVSIAAAVLTVVLLPGRQEEGQASPPQRAHGSQHHAEAATPSDVIRPSSPSPIAARQADAATDLSAQVAPAEPRESAAKRLTTSKHALGGAKTHASAPLAPEPVDVNTHAEDASVSPAARVEQAPPVEPMATSHGPRRPVLKLDEFLPDPSKHD